MTPAARHLLPSHHKAVAGGGVTTEDAGRCRHTDPQATSTTQRKEPLVTIRKAIATVAAALAALLALAGCGGSDTITDKADWPAAVETAPAPEPPAAPELDLDRHDSLGADAFMYAVDEEGIAYDSRDALLDIADQACEALAASGDDLFAAIDVYSAAGYDNYDSGYLAGASLVYCGAEVNGGERA